MALSKLDLALAVIAAAGLLWIEHHHRMVIGPLAAAEAPPTAASVCPKSDDIPYSAECIKFISGGAEHIVVPGAVERRAGLLPPPCPLRDESAPDGDSCRY